MRALFKQILKASGTPVLQTRQGGEETILSAGNIWTSAHARRIQLCDRGLAPGAVVCSDASGFLAVVDFVACTIGGFVYLPVTPSQLQTLQNQVETQPVASRTGIAFIGGPTGWDYHPDLLPRRLAGIDVMRGAQLAFYRDTPDHMACFAAFTGRTIEAWLDDLSARLGTPAGGARLSYAAGHHGLGFVVDLLLGIYNSQTIYLRDGAETSSDEMFDELIELEIDDLVLVPRMLNALAREARYGGKQSRMKIRRVRLHAGGHTLSPRQFRAATNYFGEVLVDTPPEIFVAIANSVDGMISLQRPGMHNRAIYHDNTAA